MALTLDDKPWWVGLIVGLLLGVFAVVGMEYALVKGIKEKIATADSEISELDKRIEQGKAAQRKLPQFREEVKRLELELEKLRRILPSSRNTEEIIKKFKSLVDQGDFGWQRVSFPNIGNAQGEDPYAEWPISVELTGRYHDLAILFNRLGNFSRIINVEDINITALGSQTTNTIRSTFIAKTFVYIEPPESEAASAKKPGG